MEGSAALKGFLKETPKKLWFRISFGIAAPLAVIGGLLYLYFFGNPFRCVFLMLTGLYCPGCGSGRALSNLLHFDLLTAFLFNPLFILALPFLGYYFLWLYLRIVSGKNILPAMKTSIRTYLIVIGIFVAFGILRNIPVVPFSWLAP